MTFKSGLAKHLDVTDEDASRWSPICKKFWKKYYFLIGLIVVVTIGATVPTIGNKTGPLKPKITSSWIAVCLIFLITGLSVKTKEIAKATLFWQLNLFVHFFIYIYQPLVGLAVCSFLKAVTDLSPNVLDGLIIMLCLPTTISSAVVLTVNADGNEAAAVVNTAVANLLGIMLTPALIFLFLGGLGSVDIASIFMDLALRVIAPISVGQIIRNVGGQPAEQFIKKIKPILKKVSETTLLFIIFCAISDSFFKGLEAEPIDIVVQFILCIIIHCTTLALVWYLSGVRGPPSEPKANPNPGQTALGVNEKTAPSESSKQSKVCSLENALKFTIYDRVAILFCASQKTAAFGIPIISSLFADSPYLALYLIPLLIFYPLQLIIDSLLVQPLALKVSAFEKAQEDQNETHDEYELMETA